MGNRATVPTLNDEVISSPIHCMGLTAAFRSHQCAGIRQIRDMKTFGTSTPELINHSTLTIRGVLSLAAPLDYRQFGNHQSRRLRKCLNTSVCCKIPP